MPISAEAVHDHLRKLPQRRSFDAILGLFDALGYEYADELPLPIRDWPDGVQQVLRANAESPIYLAQHRDFQIIYTHLTTNLLSRTVERPIIEQTLNKWHPYALFVFANCDLTLWDFANVKYSVENGARRHTVRRIHVGPTERLHTAAQRLALLAVPSPDTTALELQSLHDQAFDVEEVTKQFYHDYVRVFGQLCDDITRRNPQRESEAEKEAQVLLDRLMFLYFLQKKGWLNDQRDYLYQHFQTHYRSSPKGTSFFSDFLFPLFVALSNEGIASPGLGNVPFLNGGLFEVATETPPADRLVVGNKTFEAVFNNLLECYNFTVREDTPMDMEVAIDPEMLGRVFENLVLGLERGKDRRKATGSYYTPRVVVHFMCRQAIKNYLATESGLEQSRIEDLMGIGPAEQLTPEGLAELAGTLSEPQARLLRSAVESVRVLDPAVGSGAFLVGMLHEMVSLTKLLDVRLHGQQRIQRRNYDYDLKRLFIERNLYGVDIQPEAVRICELRLWLSLMVDYARLSGETVPALPNLSYRVRVGDSLVERLFGEPVHLDELAADAVARQLVDHIKVEKQSYFAEPDLAEKQRRELRILGLLCELATTLIGAKRSAVLTKMSAEVPGMLVALGDELLTKKELQAKREAETKLACYDDLREQARHMHAQVQAMQESELPAHGSDVDAVRSQLGLSFIWRLDFAEVFADRGGFDIVIANPPYIRIQTTAQLTAVDYSDYYVSATGNYDIYCLFAEKGTRLLKPGGILCYIMPHRFFKRSYGAGLRRFIQSEQNVQFVIDFDGYMVFEDASINSCVLQVVGDRRAVFKFAQIHETKRDNELLGQWLGAISRESELRTPTFSVCLLPQADLTEKPWVFVFPEEKTIWEKLRLLPKTLGDISSSIFQGLKTGADWAYILEVIEAGETTTKLRSHGGDALELETAILRPLIKGGEMKRYSVHTPQRVVVFPYERGELISAHRMKRYFPLTWQYLRRNKQRLEKRDRGKMRGPHWYGYSRKQALTAMPQRKIVTPEYYACASYCLDTDGVYYFCGGGAGGYGIVLEDGWSYEYVLALLNSRLLDWFLHKVSVRAYQTAYMYTKEYIAQLPIRLVNFNDPTDASRHDRVVTLAKQMLALQTKLRSGNEAEAALKWRIADTDAEIDALVYDLYGLTEEEIELVQKLTLPE
jgi:type I restriction-modification system DNA methylase subunit